MRRRTLVKPYWNKADRPEDGIAYTLRLRSHLRGGTNRNGPMAISFTAVLGMLEALDNVNKISSETLASSNSNDQYSTRGADATDDGDRLAVAARRGSGRLFHFSSSIQSGWA